MVGSHHFSRVDTLELKDFISRKIGQRRADNYFNQLKKFLSFKVNKADLHKSCVETIGRENLSLHNRLIRSIIHNSCHAKVPPQKPLKVEGLGVEVASGYQKYCKKSLYGDMLLQPPRKSRSPINRDSKFRDRLSPLGPLGKSPSLAVDETVTTQEQSNGEEVDQFTGSPRFQRWGTCQNSFELPDTRSLRSRLQEKLASEGVGVSLDCVNLLNNSLDVFLKRLIEPCLEIANVHSNARMVPGTNENSHGRFPPRPLYSTSASMLDFHVAMESNKLLLGDGWPTQLEKICTYTPEK